MIQKCKNSVICCIRLSHQFSFITIAHIFLCDFIAAQFHNSGLYHILYIFYIDSMSGFLNFLCNVVRHCHNLIFIHPMQFVDVLVCTFDRINDLLQVEGYLFAVSLNYVRLYFCVHVYPSLVFIADVVCAHPQILLNIVFLTSFPHKILCK